MFKASFRSTSLKSCQVRVIGESSRDNDMELNLVRGEQLNNMRSSGADKSLRIAPPRKLSLEEYMEWIGDDEYL